MKPLKMDGRVVSLMHQSRLRDEISRLAVVPLLAIVQVGEDAASELYVQKKLEMAQHLGMKAKLVQLASQVSAQALEEVLKSLSKDLAVHAILLQFPLPAHLHGISALGHIAPHKDADGLHPLNMGLLLQGCPRILPCTPQGIMHLLDYYGVLLAGKNVVILGRSLIVGTPLAVMMTQANATVTLCHRGSPDPLFWLQHADVVVSATGMVDPFSLEVLKPGAVLIDVGMIRSPSGLRGDVMCNKVPPSQLAAYTPVPFGVGPMTVIALMENVLRLALAQAPA